MLITVDRVRSNSNETLSNIFINGLSECVGLEDEYREDKLTSETRIPAGKYKVELRTVGGFHSRYSKKFPELHEGMLWIKDVPNFEYILIHIGNDDDDTAGCLLVGSDYYISEDTGEMKVIYSTNAYKKLYKRVIQAAKDGELWIEYKDSDRGN